MSQIFLNKDKFQNCVILDSNETYCQSNIPNDVFQNCVILDSNETVINKDNVLVEFQNCVILDSNELNLDEEQYAKVENNQNSLYNNANESESD